jgi:acyl-CoA synthetase (NDP forming)
MLTKEQLIKDLASKAVELTIEGRKEEAEELLAKIVNIKKSQGIVLTRVGEPDCEACQ